MNTAKPLNRYRKIVTVTVSAVVFLIFVGGLVRMTGSGMGCPDWPKCFGKWIPPTDISELPSDYKTRFQVAGKEIADFDAWKTWIEYINRLIGVLIGFFAILTAVAGFPLRKDHGVIFKLSIAGLVLIIIQGLIGAYVVKTNLQTGMITLHMMIALLIMGIYIAAWLFSRRETIRAMDISANRIPWGYIYVGAILMILTLVQVILGTQVRESVDQVAEALGEGARGNWIESLGEVYGIHKFFYYAVVVAMGYWFFQMKSLIRSNRAFFITATLMSGILLGEILLGLGMHHLGIPKIFQPLHLLLATILIGLEAGMAGTLLMIKKQ